MRWALLCALTMVFPAAVWLAGTLSAAPTAEQTQSLRAADAALQSAAKSYSAGKFKEAGETVKQAQELVSQLRNAQDLQRQLEPIVARLRKAHALLEVEGVSLPPLNLPAKEATKDASGKAPTRIARAKPTLPARGVSFVKSVAPILVSKCGRCHVNQARGGLSMASFAALERGNDDGKVIQPGKAEGSRIIEVIESGDMPRGGVKVDGAELATLKKWIDEGAKFDGPSPSDQLSRFVPNVPQAELPKLEVTAATGAESVQFSRDIAPLLVKNCFDCHGPGRQDGGQFSLETFAGLLRGGQSGLVIMPGKPAESLLIKKVRGTAGARMPLRRDPLPEAEIANIEKWIAEGAKFDAGEANQSLDFIAAVTRAKAATHDQLAAERVESAQKNWRLAIPDDKAATKETKNFLLIGNVGEETLDELGAVAEQQAATIAKMLRAPETQPLVKGRMTLFVFKRRNDYSEWRMVEAREMPRDSRGHWKYNVVEAYGCIVPPAGTEYSLPALLAQQTAATYVASLGRVPIWFAEGAGRVVASRVDPRDARVRHWDDLAQEALSGTWSAEDFLAGKLTPEKQELIAYAFTKPLMANAQKTQGLLLALRQGDAFDVAFARAYGGSPKEAFTAWSGRGATTRAPVRRGR